MICWYYRWRFESNLDDRNEASALSGHIKQCPSCRRWAEQTLRLHKALAQPATAPVTEAQIERLQTAILQTLAQPAPAKRLAFPLPAVLAAAASVLLLLGLWPLFTRPADPPQLLPEPQPVAFSLDTARLQAALTQAVRLPEASLEQQLRLLAADTRQALTHLQNCLPTPPAALPPTPD